jgi:hypothetical protein
MSSSWYSRMAISSVEGAFLLVLLMGFRLGIKRSIQPYSSSGFQSGGGLPQSCMLVTAAVFAFGSVVSSDLTRVVSESEGAGFALGEVG